LLFTFFISSLAINAYIYITLTYNVDGSVNGQRRELKFRLCLNSEHC